jgi:hypothetical protein
MQFTDTVGVALTLTPSELAKLPGDAIARQPLSTVADTPKDEVTLAAPNISEDRLSVRQAIAMIGRPSFIRSLFPQAEIETHSKLLTQFPIRLIHRPQGSIT